MGIGEYVTSSQFAVDVAENWQSEYLQFLLYIVLTVWLVQRGSPESKLVDERGGEDDEQQSWVRTRQELADVGTGGGRRTALYSNSLGLVMGLFFLGSWGAQLVAGTSAYNSERLQNLLAPSRYPSTWSRRTSGTARCRTGSRSSSRSGSMVVLSIYLRQRGSPESKPVGVAARRDRGRRLSGLAAGRVRVGISGWTYAGWRGDFYPTGLPHSVSSPMPQTDCPRSR